MSYKQTEFRKRCSLPGAGPPALCCPAAGGVPQVLGDLKNGSLDPSRVEATDSKLPRSFLPGRASNDRTDVTCATAGGSFSDCIVRIEIKLRIKLVHRRSIVSTGANIQSKLKLNASKQWNVTISDVGESWNSERCDSHQQTSLIILINLN